MGLEVPDRRVALDCLTRVGYFRSAAYRYVFREHLAPEDVDERLRQYRRDTYVPGASIEHVMKLEAFDFKLGRVCLEGLLDFEVRLRASIAHTLAAKDVAAHVSVECLDRQKCNQPKGETTKFEAWVETCRQAVRAAAEDEDFLTHHLLKYPRQEVPVWAVTEVLSFGSLPYLFDLMVSSDARAVAQSFGFTHPRMFGVVIRMMVDFRNASAHGPRLFNRVFKRAFSLGPHQTSGDMLEHLLAAEFTATPKPKQRLYIYAACLAFVLTSHSSGSAWPLAFKTQLRKFHVDVRAEDGADLVSPYLSMGFPRNWEDLALWKPNT